MEHGRSSKHAKDKTQSEFLISLGMEPPGRHGRWHKAGQLNPELWVWAPSPPLNPPPQPQEEEETEDDKERASVSPADMETQQRSPSPLAGSFGELPPGAPSKAELNAAADAEELQRQTESRKRPHNAMQI